MNDPIISPWLIYLIDTSNSIIVVSTITMVAAALLGLSMLAEWYINKDNEKGKQCKNMFRKCTFIFVVAAFAAAFIPTPQTIYKMIAASYVTPANIQATGELTDKAVDKVIDKIADSIQKFERSEKK